MSDDLADAILAAVSVEPSHGPLDIFIALVYSTVAIAQADAALAAVASAQEATRTADAVGALEAAIQGTGAASICGLALYLALAGARRHAASTGDTTGPFDTVELDELVETTRHMRDSVVHWDEKVGRDPKTFLAFNEENLIVLAPSGKTSNMRVAYLSWREIAAASRRCRDWARTVVTPPVID